MILFTSAFAMGLVMCVTAWHISHDEKNYHFGKKKDGDQDLYVDAPIQLERHVFTHEMYPTFVIMPPRGKLKEKFKSKIEKDPQYIPNISEIIVTDRGGGSRSCDIENGGEGKRYVTLKFRSHGAGKLNYVITIRGQ